MEYGFFLESDLYGSEMFEYMSLAEAIDGMERVAQKCLELGDKVARTLTLAELDEKGDSGKELAKLEIDENKVVSLDDFPCASLASAVAEMKETLLKD